jgi:hypothetical protein
MFGSTPLKGYHLPAKQAQQFAFRVGNWAYEGALAIIPVIDDWSGAPADEALPTVLVVQWIGLRRTPPTDLSGHTPAQYDYMAGVQNTSNLDVDFHLDWHGPF